MLAKKILFSFFSIFLGYQSYGLVMQTLNTNPSTFSLLETVTIAFLLNLFITGIFAFVGFVFPTNKILGTSYYRIRNAPLLNRVYELFQVETFRKILLFFFWGRGKNKTKYFNGTRQGLANFSYQSKQSEFGHLLALVFVDLVCITLLLFKHYQIATIATIINIIGNLYPIILQRHHRIRIDRILNS